MESHLTWGFGAKVNTQYKNYVKSIFLKVPQIAHKFQDIESQIDATLDPDTCSLLASSVQLVFHLRCEQITEEPGSSLYSNPKTTLSISLYCVGYLGDTLG